MVVWLLPYLRKVAYVSAGLLFIVYALMGLRLQTGEQDSGNSPGVDVSQEIVLLAKATDAIGELSMRDLGRKADVGAPGYREDGDSDAKLNDIRILDCFIYNGEMVVELRLQYLYDVVDEIIVVEGRTTFSGVAKPELFIERDRARFEPYMDKVTFLIIDDYPEPDPDWVQRQTGKAWMTDLTVWYREAYQRNFPGLYIQEKYAGMRYVVLACDVDEIPKREVVAELRSFRYEHAHIALYFELEFSYYNFDWTAPNKWYHAFSVSDIGMAQKSLDEYRTENARYHLRQDAGWHLSYYMPIADLARKIESFSHKEYNQPEYKGAEHIRGCIRDGKDLFNRGPDFDLLPASEELKASRPEGWEAFAERLAAVQEL